MSGTASLEVRQVVDALSRSIPLDTVKLAGEFFPAHLPVAVIDAVLRSRLRHGERPAPIAERYCRQFGLPCRRPDRWEPPPVDGQETLGDLIRRYDEFGMDCIATKVFQSRHRFPGTKITRAENVLRAADALRGIGVDVLQDVPARRPAEIDDPVQSPLEMGSLWPDVVAKLYQDQNYPRLFKALYPDGITRNSIRNALAEFMRSLTTPNSRFDRWLKGDEAAHTAPYLHDGSAATLGDAGDAMFEFQLGREAPHEDKEAIVAFIKTLAGESKELSK